MGQVLSQNEIETILKAINEEGNPVQDVDGEKPMDNIRPYDLANQDRVLHGKMPVMEIIYERFARLFRVSLSNSLRKMASVSMTSIDLLKIGEFINTLSIPSCICVMRFNALSGPAMMVFESKLAYAIIDSYFGGTDRLFTKIEGKEFTMIELAFMKKIMEMAINNLGEAWERVVPIDVQYLRTEINPQFVGIAPPSETVIVTTIEVEFESASGSVMIAVPHSTIESVKHQLNSSIQTDRQKMNQSFWENIMHEHIRDIDSNIIVNMGEMTMKTGDLLNLKEGDVIPFDTLSEGEARVFVEDIEKMRCSVGTNRGNKAIQITCVTDR